MKIAFDIVTPDVPNDVFIEGVKGASIPVEELTEKQCVEIGKDWTKRLVDRSKRNEGSGASGTGTGLSGRVIPSDIQGDS